jgi:phytanoyl-CoA hydroxylase
MPIDLKSRTTFFEHGYLHLPSFIDPIECKRLILRMHELVERKCQKENMGIFATKKDHHSKDAFFLSSANKIAFFFDKNAQTLKGAKKSHFSMLNKVGHALHDICPVYRKFSHQNKFYALVAMLGIKKPLLVQSMFIFKQPRFGDEVPMHQDASFIYTEPTSVIGLWFALENADENNGCLWVLAGGHKGKLKNRFFKTKEGLDFAFNQKVYWPKEKFCSLPAKAGDVIVLHGLVPHFSEQNQSLTTRFAYTIHFIDQKCHYAKTNWLDISFL